MSYSFQEKCILDPSFNGGKMLHIFELDKSLYTQNFTSPEAKEAFEMGEVFVKIDGSNACVKKGGMDGEWTLYRRLDSRGKDISGNKDIISLPDGENPATYGKHTYNYQLVDPNVKGKNIRKMHRRLCEIVKLGSKTLDSLTSGDFLTVELVGSKMNNTIEVANDIPYHIAVHCQQGIDIPPKYRTFDGIKKILVDDVICEGFVFLHKGKYWKLIVDCFQKGSKFHRREIDNVEKIWDIKLLS